MKGLLRELGVVAIMLCAFTGLAKAQVCDETAPCQQLACMQVQVYCINCGGNPECIDTGYSCDQYTVWSDWWFGTTCDEQVGKYCVFGSCGSLTFSGTEFKERSNAQRLLARVRIRNRQRAG